jgi:hypothetical protein
MILQRNGVSYCSTRSERRRRQPFPPAEAEAFRDPCLGADAWRSARPRTVGPTPPSRSSDADGECASEKDNNEEPEGEEEHPGHGVPPPLSRFRSVKRNGARAPPRRPHTTRTIPPPTRPVNGPTLPLRPIASSAVPGARDELGRPFCTTQLPRSRPACRPTGGFRAGSKATAGHHSVINRRPLTRVHRDRTLPAAGSPGDEKGGQRRWILRRWTHRSSPCLESGIQRSSRIARHS